MIKLALLWVPVRFVSTEPWRELLQVVLNWTFHFGMKIYIYIFLYLWLIYFVPGSMYLLIFIYFTQPPLATMFCFCDCFCYVVLFCFFKFHIKMKSYIIWLTSLCIIPSQVHPCGKWQIFILGGWVVFHFTYVTFFSFRREGTAPVACRRSLARDQTCTTAVT